LGEFFSKIFNENQIFGAILFIVGVALLTWCAKVERKQMAKMRDPKLKWAYIDADGKLRDEVKKRNRRSIIATLLGGGMALYGFIDFLVNVK
jgi:hypothetical protein